MSARDEILAKLRKAAVPPLERPETFTDGIQFEDPVMQFKTVLEGVGGRCELCDSRDSVQARLQELPVYQEAAKRCSLVDGIGETNFDLAGVTDPHELADVDVAVLPGQWAVAENAAVWVTDERIPHRVLYFLMQHLVLVVPTRNVLHNLHQAYARLTIGEQPFSCWISGPSKTADIEQSLVIGAHGAALADRVSGGRRRTVNATPATVTLIRWLPSEGLPPTLWARPQGVASGDERPQTPLRGSRASCP